MRQMKVIPITAILLIVVSLLPGGRQPQTQPETVFALCRPQLGQIKNIETMYEKEIINIYPVRMIGIYHEDELTDYESAIDYVKENRLHWVEIVKITGKVKRTDIFQNNLWSPQFKKIFETTSGIIFTGGADIPPDIYGQETKLLTNPSTPVRSIYEVSFLFHLIGGSQNPGFKPLLADRPQYTVLGICLGCQSMNVAAGGSLYQDIPMDIYGHRSYEEVLSQDRDKIHSSLYLRQLHPGQKNMPPAFHRIRFIPGNKFAHSIGVNIDETPLVLTSHHQSIDRLGAQLKAAATSMDGKIVEAIEHKKFPNVFGVQFHPEHYLLYQKGRTLRKEPDGEEEINIRHFLINNHNSFKFHQKLWNWFSRNIAKSRR